MLGWELPPHNSGGLGVACLNLAKKLASSGADIEFVLPYSADYAIDFMRISSSISDVKSWDALTAYDSFRFNHIIEGETDYIKKVMTVIDERSFDVIHAHDWLTFRAALRAKEATGWPLIAHIHSVESDRAGGHGNPIVREIEQLTLLLADKVVAVSEHTKQKIINDYGVPADKITVIHNSLDLEDLEPLDHDNAYKYLTFMKQKGYKVVCNLGRQTLQKGLPNLLQAAQQVINYQPKTFFLLVGDGEQQRELIELAANLGISRNILFAGFQRGKEVRDAFAIADIFVMPSVSEPFGLTPLEAIGYGTPTLISKQSGVAEVLHHTLKVDFWDVNEMANQIVAAVRDQALLNSLYDNAWQELQSFSWQKSADKFMQTYSDVSQVAA